MNEQHVNSLRETVNHLLRKLGREEEVDENLSDEGLYVWLGVLADKLALVHRLVRLRLKNYGEACEYVCNLDADEVQAELELSDNQLVQKFKDKRHDDGGGCRP